MIKLYKLATLTEMYSLQLPGHAAKFHTNATHLSLVIIYHYQHDKVQRFNGHWIHYTSFQRRSLQPISRLLQNTHKLNTTAINNNRKPKQPTTNICTN